MIGSTKSGFVALACALALAFSAAPTQAAAAGAASAAKASATKAKPTAKAKAKATAKAAPTRAAAPKAAAVRLAATDRDGKAVKPHALGKASTATGRRATAAAQTASRARVVKTIAVAAAPTASRASIRNARRGARMEQAAYMAAPSSIGASIGLKATDDPLALHSSVAYVVDQDSGETLFEKNSQAVLPIASITKLMTALVTLEARLPLGEMLEVTEAEIDTEKHTRSRLAVGTRLTRGEMLHLALMASENRASHALGRTYPGGLPAFMAAMNAKARALGMHDTIYNDPTGLSSRNQSNARDLIKLMRVAYEHPIIREYSTASDLTIDTGHRVVTFRNTNRLVRENAWDIGLQKTGFINEAGNCLVMQTRIDERRVWVVLLDAHGGQARATDAWRLRRFIGGELRNFSTLKVRSPA